MGYADASYKTLAGLCRAVLLPVKFQAKLEALPIDQLVTPVSLNVAEGQIKAALVEQAFFR